MIVLKYIYLIFMKMSKLLSRKGIYPFLRDEFNKITASQKVLTIGSGGEINKLLMQFRDKANFHVTSLDISEDRQPEILGDICSYDFGESKFDIIVIAEVLEHLYAPHLALNNIHAALNENGTLILTVPFIFPIHERPYDYYRYTKYGLAYLLNEFSDVKITERNNWAEAINALIVRLIMDNNKTARILSPIFILVAYINLPIIYLLSKIIKTDFITTGYLVTAKKLAKNPLLKV